MDATPSRHRRRLLTVLAALLLVPGLLSGPAHAAPLHGAPAPLAPLDQSAVMGRVTPGLVDINTTLNYQSAVGAGTGIVLDPSGEVLTNNHVIEGATSITATSLANGRTYPVDVIGFDRANDIALVRLRGAGDLPVASLGTSSAVAVGDAIAAIGNAGGAGGAPSFSPGNITQLGASVRASDESGGGSRELTDLIRVAADVRPGDSGGPLVNSAGQVVGVNVAATLTYRMGNVRGGEGFAIPIDRAIGVAGAIRSGGGPGVHIGDTAFIGVGIADPAAGGPAGAVVRQVLPDTAARGAGLAAGDVITSADGVAINTATDLSNFMDAHHPGDTVTLSWVDREGNPRSAPIVLGSGPVG
ncbi:S1C family serine protease [Mycolicibacterium sp. P1-5]|uniref:S1C family serine protease n=1 Tax=Mycolicibacterium sp. P1-5 TaxID=2024617 RepID=UPI0011EF57E5|nr:trypsin-like peptidase domain-containing protein [Mycolicibacterium sp. P1-5]KAA0108408.1 PDZ domain-containing protein [Mycolicibacterium sp. P1-5]